MRSCFLTCPLAFFVAMTMNGIASGASGNLIENSSFELELRKGWAGKALEPRKTTKNVPAKHGQYLLSMEGCPHRWIADYWDSSELRSQLYPLDAGKTYTFSVWARSDNPKTVQLSYNVNLVPKPKEPVEMRRTSDGRPGLEWKRYSLTFTVPEDATDTQCHISIGGRYVMIDAMQLEQGEAPSDFQPHYPIEAALLNRSPIQIYELGKENFLDFAATCGFGATKPEKFTVKIVDYWERVVAERKFAIDPAKGARQVLPCLLPADVSGAFRGEVYREDGSPESDLCFSILPNPRDIPAEESYFGSAFNTSDEHLARVKALGVKWYRSQDDSLMHRWLEPEPGKWVYPDKEINRVLSYGFEIMCCFRISGTHSPQWSQEKDYSDSPLYPSLKIDLKTWETYVYNIVSHFRGRIKYFELTPEKYHANDPKSFLEVVRTGYAAAKRANPDCVLLAPATYQAMTAWTEDVLELGVLKYTDIFSHRGYDTISPGSLKHVIEWSCRDGIRRRIFANEAATCPYDTFYKITRKQFSTTAPYYDGSRWDIMQVVNNIAHGSRPHMLYWLAGASL
ncbi:MAG: carbohydrate binding domain-containing protein, partial [Lentisphaerae bacterium]|nr:carbohydrate binding domain-containing protein [Lentisphaerota bacterium]